jgi:hypothetical protein
MILTNAVVMSSKAVRVRSSAPSLHPFASKIARA